MRIWCERGWIDDHVANGVLVEETDGRIAEVRVGVEASEGSDVVLPGLVVPGLANTHSHAFHRALRGSTNDGGGTFWTWRAQMYRVSAQLDPSRYRRLATAVFAEMLLAGYTVVGEFHYVHHRPDGSAYDDADMERAVLAAAADAGIRITLLDTLYLRGGLDSTGRDVPLNAEQRRFSDGSVAGWRSRHRVLSPSPTARIGAAVHSVRAVSAADLREFREATRGVPVHAHVSEQQGENDQVLAATGLTPTAVLAGAGFVDDAFTAVHATHLDSEAITTLGAASAHVCLCPTTEQDLADGIGPGGALHRAGARLAVGSDQHAIVDPFAEMRGVEMHERLATGRRGSFAPDELLMMGGVNGYRSLGWEGGKLAPGSVCDLVAVDAGSARTAGAHPSQLLFAATAADVTDVVVGGRHVVRGGRHMLGDVGALLASSIAEVTR